MQILSQSNNSIQRAFHWVASNNALSDQTLSKIASILQVFANTFIPLLISILLASFFLLSSSISNTIYSARPSQRHSQAHKAAGSHRTHSTLQATSTTSSNASKLQLLQRPPHTKRIRIQILPPPPLPPPLLP